MLQANKKSKVIWEHEKGIASLFIGRISIDKNNLSDFGQCTKMKDSFCHLHKEVIGDI